MSDCCHVEHEELVHFIAYYPPESLGPGQTWGEEYDWLAENDYEYFQQLVQDIRENGMNEPVVVGSDNRVWDGHHRVCAAIQLGLERIPVRYIRGGKRQ